jgi:hypothetical protein
MTEKMTKKINHLTRWNDPRWNDPRWNDSIVAFGQALYGIFHEIKGGDQDIGNPRNEDGMFEGIQINSSKNKGTIYQRFRRKLNIAKSAASQAAQSLKAH